jgi:dGTPase
VRSGLIDMEQLEAVPLFARFLREALAQHPRLNGRRLLFETIRRMLSAQVYDVLDATSRALAAVAPASVDDVRRAGPLVSFGEQMAHDSVALKRFLRANLYRHPKVVVTTDSAKQVIRDLFAAYQADPGEAAQGRFADSPRGTADYIAGMTDRFALKEHERLTGRRLFD